MLLFYFVYFNFNLKYIQNIEHYFAYEFIEKKDMTQTITETEQKYVREVYDNIASHFSATRVRVWKFVKYFLDSKTEQMKGIDIGCGNGKNMLYKPCLDILGIDSCQPFVDMCKLKGLKTQYGDFMDIPSQSNTFDYAYSIAVFHHFSTEDNRKKSMNEMIRVLKPGGHGMFSVWSVENQQKEKKVREFSCGDNYVKWTRQTDNKDFERYYYVYNYEMIEKFIRLFEDKIGNIKIYNEQGNWVVEFIKF